MKYISLFNLFELTTGKGISVLLDQLKAPRKTSSNIFIFNFENKATWMN